MNSRGTKSSLKRFQVRKGGSAPAKILKIFL
jgi:hypothetical protein